jgi:hypothetical protein
VYDGRLTMTMTYRALTSISLVLALPACADDGGTSASGAATTTPVTTLTTGASDPTTGGAASTGGDTSGSASDGGTTTTGTTGMVDPTEGSGGVKFDLPAGADVGPPAPTCKVVDDMDAIGDCTDKAPPDSFEPEAQWTFTGPPGFENCIVTPLVANLTDDNGDGEIDLCDIPDVIVVAGPDMFSDVPPSRLYVLDGLTGNVHFYAPELVQFGATPALGDIDGDGLVEIVAVEPGPAGHLIAFEHDGTVKWKSNTVWQGAQSSAIALADIDHDGDVEIVASSQLWDHNGVEIWQRGSALSYSASAIADLDGQPGMEVLIGGAAFHADGSMWYDTGTSGWTHPQVANLDDDPMPEVLLARDNVIELREHDGALKWSFTPNGQSDLSRPINIHDFDGDQKAEFGISAPSFYGVYEADQTNLWTAMVVDNSGQAGGTAFDFIGGGKAQAIYADEQTVWVFDDKGSSLMSTPHKSGTIIEYPVVADIDNDGSSEILVVSNTLLVGGVVPFTVQAVRDIEDRWVQGRRIWNQHTYHVTNVREDGTIPQVEPKHWESLNTFRTQAQISAGGGVCQPPPPN